jgi:hypothetical protein
MIDVPSIWLSAGDRPTADSVSGVLSLPRRRGVDSTVKPIRDACDAQDTGTERTDELVEPLMLPGQNSLTR